LAIPHGVEQPTCARECAELEALAEILAQWVDDAPGVLNIYNNANKVFNLVKGLPIGGVTWGAGGIGVASTATMVKDLRRRLSGEDPAHANWEIDRGNYTVEAVARRVREFFFDELFAAAYGTHVPANYFLGFKVCGYSAGAPLSEVWDVKIINDTCDAPTLTQQRDWFGARWDGEYETMDRLILGFGSRFPEECIAFGLDKPTTDRLVQPSGNEGLIWLSR
jgi:hypothetical protein